MNKNFWIGFIVVFIAMSVIEYLIHGVMLVSTYQSDALRNLWRPDMQSKIWIFYMVYFIQSFFFTLIFSKGYEGKGIGEGVRYGLYVGIWMATPMAYASYAMFPIPYSLALEWFLFTTVESLILGVLVAMVYSKKPSVSARV